MVSRTVGNLDWNDQNPMRRNAKDLVVPLPSPLSYSLVKSVQLDLLGICNSPRLLTVDSVLSVLESAQRKRMKSLKKFLRVRFQDSAGYGHGASAATGVQRRRQPMGIKPIDPRRPTAPTPSTCKWFHRNECNPFCVTAQVPCRAVSCKRTLSI